MRAPFVALLVLGVGCGDDAAVTHDAAPDAIDYTIGEHPALAIACSDSLADVYALPTDLPTMDDSRRGDVFRCAKSEKLIIPEIKAQIAADNQPFPKAVPGIVQSGFWTYRIAYRSTRNTVNDARAEGDMAATLMIPAKPIEGAPLVEMGHGSVGLAAKCAPSRVDLSGAIPDVDPPSMQYRLAAYGYTVIMPDYSGYSYGQPPGYFNAEDEAHAILDATRAAAKVLPVAPSKVVFVGYSQGGHAVLAAHSYAKSYGMAGELVGVATLAPFWTSMSIWAAGATETAGLTTADNWTSVLYTMGYAYSAAELREGNGEVVFQTDKQAAAVETLLSSECYDQVKLQALGATPPDFYEADYVSIVGQACALSGNCTGELAQKWRSWWLEDRPAIDAMGAPILAIFGGADEVVTPGRAGCGQKKLEADLAAVNGATTSVKYCVNKDYDHRDLPRGPGVDYINEWIAARAGAGPEPAACTPYAMQFCASIPVDH